MDTDVTPDQIAVVLHAIAEQSKLTQKGQPIRLQYNTKLYSEGIHGTRALFLVLERLDKIYGMLHIINAPVDYPEDMRDAFLFEVTPAFDKYRISLPAQLGARPIQELIQPVKQTNKIIKHREFDRKLKTYADNKMKKNSRLSIPDIARQLLTTKEDFLYLLKPRSKEPPKRETIEKHLRKLLKQP